jgi:hypothetical protein
MFLSHKLFQYQFRAAAYRTNLLGRDLIKGSFIQTNGRSAQKLVEAQHCESQR